MQYIENVLMSTKNVKRDTKKNEIIQYMLHIRKPANDTHFHHKEEFMLLNEKSTEQTKKM